MAKYNRNESLGANAIRGVDITEETPPYEVVITDDKDWKTPEKLTETINEFLYNKYGYYPSSYSYEIVVGDLEWENE